MRKSDQQRQHAARVVDADEPKADKIQMERDTEESRATEMIRKGEGNVRNVGLTTKTT